MTPRHRNSEGYVYVIEFASGIVKVGQTRRAKARLRAHLRNAEIHGNSISRSWVSDLHAGYEENEAALLTFCAGRWSTSSGVEYFADADFDQVVEHAQGLRYVRLTKEEIAAERIRCQRIVAGLSAGFELARELAAVKRAKAKVGLILPLINGSNRWVGCDALFEVLKELYAATPSPWAENDPTAAERYLITCGASPGTAQRTAAEYEIGMRALYAMTFQAEAESFDEIARFSARFGSAS